MLKSVADFVLVAAVSTGVSAPAPQVPEKQVSNPTIVQTQIEQTEYPHRVVAQATGEEVASKAQQTAEEEVAPEPTVTQEVTPETQPTTTEELPPQTQPVPTEEETVKTPVVPGVLSNKAEPSLFQAPPKPEPPKTEPVQKPAINYDYDIASYITKYSGAESLNRNYNMRLASDSINGVVLQPGEVFSYNNIILAKSHNGKDYKEAGVYNNGKLDTGIGGGICQISSTLYQAALYSGMEITQRRNHSLKVGYMPAGRDATASWGSIDFKFKNPLNVPVKIESVIKNGTLKVRFLAPSDPKVGDIKVNVEQKDGAYYLSRVRENGVVDYTAVSRYK